MNKKAEGKLTVQMIVSILLALLLFFAVILALRSKFAIFSPWLKMKLVKFNRKGMESRLIVILIILAITLFVVGMFYLLLRNESNTLLDMLLGIFG